MRGMLVIFMVNQLMLDATQANLQYGATQAFVYAFTFIGACLPIRYWATANRYIGVALLMIAGSLILAIDPVRFSFWH